MFVADRKLPQGDAELEDLLKQVREEAAYYRNIAQEVGKRHLRETEQLSRVITELKQTGAALQKSDERFRQTADLSPSMICEIDTNMMLTYVNSSGYEMFGYSKEDLDAGMNATNFFHPDDKEKVVKRAEQIFQGKKLEATEYRMLTKNGSEIATLVNSAPIYKNGKVVGIRSNLVDVTKTKQLQAQLEQAQRMEAMGTLSGGIAHDFNNVLMAIQGHASLMLLHIDSDHPHFHHLKGIEDSVQSAATLAKQLLGFARRGKYDVKPTNLNDLVYKSSEMFGRTRKEIDIHRKCREDIWPVEVDRSQIEQVFLNLYVNAWHAMPGGGNLYITTTNVVLDGGYTKPFSVEPGNYVKISVSDSGEGMDEALQERIFDPFFTTKDMGRGTGLGLASAYGIIQNHAGIITVDSKKSHGTTFDIYLPASQKAVATEEKKVADEVSKGTETVLIVDDEHRVLDVGKNMLESMGYKVLSAKDGKQAVEACQKNRDEIDLVILDMVMPGMSGGESYDRIKAIGPGIKVLLASGYSINGEASEILKRGCDGFIQKPFNINELSEKIREILDKK